MSFVGARVLLVKVRISYKVVVERRLRVYNQTNFFSILKTHDMADNLVETSSAAEGENAAASYEALFLQGKRNLVCKEIQQAVNQLQEAARLVSEKFGETANECAEVYLYYGTALLELARIENTVLGNALAGIPAEEPGEEEEAVVESTFVEPDNTTEEEKEKISEEVIEAMVESDDKEKDATAETEDSENKENDASSAQVADAEDKTKEQEAANKDDEPSKDKEVAGEPSENENAEAEGDAAGDDDGEGEDTAGEDTADETAEEAMDEGDGTENTSQEEVSSLQLAWEMVELAKNIYKRGELPDSKLKEADCLLRLGEVGLETEQYAQAVSDFSDCLKLLESAVEPSSRRLAETHYQVALAHGYNNAFDDSISHYRSAVKIIELKIAELQVVLNKANNSDDANAELIETTEKEIEEMQSLIPEIQIKIDDAEEEKKSQDQKAVIREIFKPALVAGEGAPSAFQEEGFSSSELPSSSGAEQPIKVITHLVRKKRKLEDEETAESDAKKVKSDDEATETKVNGESKSEAMEATDAGETTPEQSGDSVKAEVAEVTQSA